MSQAQGTVATMEIPESDGAELVVVLGGGIGSGKTTVAALFAESGFEVIVADEVGRGILATGSAATEEVLRTWPKATAPDGSLDRAALAEIVFADPAELARLESITHPAIASAISETIAQTASREILVEVPLQHLDLAIGEGTTVCRMAVVAPAAVRLARAVARGGAPDDVRRRMERQPDDPSWRAWADHVIENDGAWTVTEANVRALVEEVRTDG